MLKKDDKFNQFFLMYFKPLSYYVRQYIDREEDCQDIVSDVYEDLWRNYSHVRSDTMKAYLYRATKNRIIDFLRKRNYHLLYLNASQMAEGEHAEVELQFDREDKLTMLKQFLLQLGEPTASVLVACYIDEKRYCDVAEEMNMSLANVKKHMVKALRMIREERKKHS